MSTDAERDDWGFSDADHAELRVLMKRHQESLPSVLTALMEDGVAPMPEDPGMMGLMAHLDPEGNTRVFPKGGLWWSLLGRLRELDKGGA
jgi:hypothetical protein